MKQTAAWLIMALMLGACTEVTPYRIEPGELFPDGKPVGQPYTSKRTDIRMVRVSSVQEADSFFTALCRNGKYEQVFTYHPSSGRKMRYYWADTADGEMLYTHDVPEGTYEVGIIHIRDSAINAKGIREVHFVETVKLKRK